MRVPFATVTNHTGITVSDLQAAISFFREVMGFTVSDVVEQRGPAVARITGVANSAVDIAFVQAPGHQIELLQFVSPPPPANPVRLEPNDCGCAHLAFEVADIDSVATQLEEAGFPPINPPEIVPAGPRKGGKNVYVHGPAGLILEFQQAPSGG